MTSFQDADCDDPDPPPSPHGTDASDKSDDSRDSVFSSPLFSPGVACSSTTTSHDRYELESVGSDTVSMPSPAPSVYSLTNSLREQSFRREYGREVNNHSEIYRLPADEEEFLRLENQHRMFTIMMGPWVAPLPDVLAPEAGSVKSVLDLGCGTGAWITNVARAFPECSAVGVDLVPPSMVIPPNCRIEVDDINLGLEHFYDSFDVVQTRLISSGIKDYAGLVDHIARCLRPRGLIVLYECEYRLYNPDKTLCAPWSGTLIGAPYLCRWFLAFGNAVRRRGGHIDAAPLLHLWVRQHHSFAKEDIVYQEYWYPTSPFEHSKEWGHIDPFPREVPEMMREDLKSLLQSGRPLLLGGGMHPSDVDHLQTNAQCELEQSKIPIMVKMHCVYARKKGRPDK